MLRILAVGNSFSEDATYYLHQILEIAGVENQVVNLYIGGCSLEKHWRNIEKNAREYQFQFNGTKTDRRVTVKEVLKEAKWDVIVTQQASHDSGWLDTYEPFLGKIVAYFRENAPEARLFLHETWAYEKSSDHESFARYNRDQQEMFDRLQSAYTAMAGKYQLQLITCGEMIQKLRKTPYFQEEGDRSICRDGFHMHYLYGRYALGCMWAAAIAGVSIKDNAFQPYTEYLPYGEPGAEILKCIRKIVAEMPHS